MKHRSNRTAKALTFLAVALAGGLVPGTCQLRVRDALVEGGRLFFLNLFTVGGADSGASVIFAGNTVSETPEKLS